VEDKEIKIFSSTTVQKVSENTYVLRNKDMEVNSTFIVGKKLFEKDKMLEERKNL